MNGICTPVQKNDTHKILWDFRIQMDHRIIARQPDLLIVYKKENMPNSGLCRSA